MTLIWVVQSSVRTQRRLERCTNLCKLR